MKAKLRALFKKKVAGIPVPILALAAAVLGYLIWKKRQAGASASSGSSSGGAGFGSDQTGGVGDSAGSAADYSSGDFGGGGFGGALGPMAPQADAGGIGGHSTTTIQKIIKVRRRPLKWKVMTPRRKPHRPAVVNRIVINPRYARQHNAGSRAAARKRSPGVKTPPIIYRPKRPAQHTAARRR